MWPVDSASLQEVTALAFLAATLVQVVKLFGPDKRLLNIVAIAGALGFSFLATLVEYKFQPYPEHLFVALTTGIFSAGLATLGSEAIQNIRGVLGYGGRSDTGQIQYARRMLQVAGEILDAEQKQAGEDRS